MRYRRIAFSLENKLLMQSQPIFNPLRKVKHNFFQIFKEQPSHPAKGGNNRTPRLIEALDIRYSRPMARMKMVEANGIEPMTPCLQSRCSPS